MATQRVTMSYDDEKHTTVHLGLVNHDENSASDYLRKCVEFFEMNKGGVNNQQRILEELAAIRLMLKKGVAVSGGDDQPHDPQGEEILDELLEQME